MSIFINALKNRRTIYDIADNISTSEQELSELIFTVIEQSPSSFNSQTSRAVILFGEAHHYLWDKIVRETLRKIVGDGDFSSSSKRMDSFNKGFGTILFFEDYEAIDKLKEKFPLYADKFEIFSHHSSGMAQLAVWTALAEEKIGASLQHYNPIIDEEVKAYWNIPARWELVSQMPFGSIESPAGDKVIIGRDNRFLVKNK